MLLTELRISSPAVLLSPHHDDAVWSLGAIMLSLKKLMLLHVITIFTKSSYIYGEITNTENASKLRALENQKALNSIGVNNVHDFNIPEAILRGKNLNNQFDVVPAVEVKSTVQSLMGAVTDKIHQIRPNTIFAPVAFGGHIDHVLTRELVNNEETYNILYYEDMPYVCRDKNKDNSLEFIHDNELKRITIALSKPEIDLHLKLYDSYPSQRLERHKLEIAHYLNNHGIGIWAKR